MNKKFRSVANRLTKKPEPEEEEKRVESKTILHLPPLSIGLFPFPSLPNSIPPLPELFRVCKGP